MIRSVLTAGAILALACAAGPESDKPATVFAEDFESGTLEAWSDGADVRRQHCQHFQIPVGRKSHAGMPEHGKQPQLSRVSGDDGIHGVDLAGWNPNLPVITRDPWLQM